MVLPRKEFFSGISDDLEQELYRSEDDEGKTLLESQTTLPYMRTKRVWWHFQTSNFLTTVNIIFLVINTVILISRSIPQPARLSSPLQTGMSTNCVSSQLLSPCKCTISHIGKNHEAITQFTNFLGGKQHQPKKPCNSSYTVSLALGLRNPSSTDLRVTRQITNGTN